MAYTMDDQGNVVYIPDDAPQEDQQAPIYNSGGDAPIYNANNYYTLPTPSDYYSQESQAAPAPPSWGDIFGAVGNALNYGQDYNQQSSYNYNPETPFNQNDYQQQQQPQVPSWNELPSVDETPNYYPQPQQPSVADFYGQESKASALPPPTWDQLPSVDETQQAYQSYQPDSFKSDGSVSSIYGQESQLPTITYDQYGNLISQDPTARYDLNSPAQAGGASWGQLSVPDYNHADNGKPYVPQARDFANRPTMPYEEGYNSETGGAANTAALFGPVTTANSDATGFVKDLLAKQFPGVETDPGKRLQAYNDYFDPATQFGKLAETAPVALGPLGLPFVAGSLAAGAAAQGAVSSGIPGISNMGSLVQAIYGGVVAPLLNITPSIVGDMMNGNVNGFNPKDPYHLNPKNDTQLQKTFQALDPSNAPQMEAWREQQIKTDIAQQLAQGATPEQAGQHAATVGITLLNPLNYSEQAGMKQFSSLPAPVQTAVQWLDPIGNKVFETALSPALKALPASIHEAAGGTGIAKATDTFLDNTVRPGSQQAFKQGLVADRIGTTLAEQGAALQMTAPDVLRSFLYDTKSPIYSEKLLANFTDSETIKHKQGIVDLVKTAWEASPDPMAKGYANPQTSVLTGEKIGTTPNELAFNAQDTGQRPTPKPVDPNAPTTPPATTPPTAEPIDPKVAAQNAASQGEFNAITAERPPAPAEPVPLPEKYKPIPLPDKVNGSIPDFFNFAKTAYAVDVKALKLDNTLGKPTLRPAKMLEEWGALGAAIRGVNKYTTVPLSRVYLESLSRAVRDPLGNYSKMIVEKPELVTKWVHDKLLGDKTNSIAAQYEKKFATTQTDSMGPASMSADLEGKRSTNGVANLAYTAANPFNELTAAGIRKATGGKFQSYNQFIENREADAKTLYNKGIANAEFDRLEAEGPKTEFFQKNPALLKKIQSGKVSMDQAVRMLQANTYNGFDVNDLINGKYNPVIFSDALEKEFPGVSAGTYGPFGKAMKDGIDSLADRVAEQNNVNLLNYLQDSGTRVYGGDLSKVNPKVLARARAAVKEIKLEDLDSTHPLVQQMLGNVRDGFDATRMTLFPQDNALYDFANMLTTHGANYAREAGRYDLFVKSLNDRVLADESAGKFDKFNPPPTDFQRMMALKDKYESGAPLTKKQIQEYEAFRDKTPIRQMAANADVKMPEAAPGSASMFDKASTLADYEKTIRDTEKFSSSSHDEFGGESLTVADQKRLSEALFNQDRAAFDALVKDIKANPRYTEGVTGKGVYTDKSRANADRTVNRLEKYWEDATNKSDTTASPGLPAANLPGPDLKAYNEAIGNPPVRRLAVGTVSGGKKAFGNVLTPDGMQKLASKFNRKDTFKSSGDVYNEGTSREQMNQYLRDFQATDAYIRQATNNTFKLDASIAAPVRISDGMSLDELMGKSRPAKIGPNVPDLTAAAKEAGYDMQDLTVKQVGDLMQHVYGEKAMQDWTDMAPAERNAIQQDVAKNFLGVDPLNPLTNPKGSAEHAKATEMLQRFTSDMDSRKAKWQSDNAKDAAHKAEGKALDEQFEVNKKEFTESVLAERFKNAYAAKEAGYTGTKGVFFDYRDKNRIDQVLGTVLPFQYWARQNFAYLARHFSANPYHFAAILNFYQQLEKENSDPTIPSYGKFNIHLAKGNGQHLMWDISSTNPFNPLGSSQSFGGLTLMSDQDFQDAQTNNTVANDTPLGLFTPQNVGQFLFGKDKTNAAGKVTGRDKGVLSNWLSPNPLIKDTLMQTGLLNKGLQGAGILGPDQTTLGQDYPEDTRGQHARLGLIPGAAQVRDLAAVSGVTKTLRNAGVIKGDLDLEGPFNEAAYGKNAGKQQSAIFQELASMAQKGEITADESKLAVAAYKDGSYNSKALLAALDRVDADQAGLRLASMVGFSAQLFNTPRQQVTNQIYADENKAYAANPAGYRLDENGNAVANTSATSKFYKDNAGANVLSQTQSTDTPETIKKSIADDKTYDAIAALKAQRKDGTLDYPTYTAELNKLQGENPVFFKNNPYYAVTPGEAKYENLVDQYKAIGGQNFDDMQAKAFAAKDKGDEDGYKKIVSSQAYKTASNQRLDFLLANPEFQKQYTDNNEQYSRERTQELVGGVGRSNPQLAPKPQKTLEDLQYTKTTNQYYDIGGDTFSKLQNKAYAAKDNGDDATYRKIVSSPDYQDAEKKRTDFIINNPDWYKQYSDVQVSKGGSKSPVQYPSQSSKDFPNFFPKQPRTIDQIKLDQVTSKYTSIGGDAFDSMQKKAYDLRAKGDEDGFKQIIASPEYQAAQKKRNEFILDNPDWYNAYIKDPRYAHLAADANTELVGGLGRTQYNLRVQGKTLPDGSKPPKTIPDVQYAQQLSEYYAKGGTAYDKQQADIKKYFDAGQDSKAYDIINSRDYQRVQSTLDQYKLENPDFAKRYDAEYTAKYGKAPKSEADKVYDEQRSAYYGIGGAWFDQQQKKIQDLFDAGKSSDAYTLQSDRDYQRAVANRQQYMIDNPDFATRYNADYTAKYGKAPKSIDEQDYTQQKSEYFNIGQGSQYEALQNLVNGYMAKGDKKSAGLILGSDAYKQANAARKQYLADNPEFATRYKAEQEAKYGPSPTTTAAKASTSSYSTSSSKKTTTYTSKSSGGSKSSGSSSSYAPYTQAQKVAYAKALATGKGTAYAQAAARNALNTPAPAKTITTTTAAAAPAKAAASAGTSTSSTPYTAAQKKAYATALAKKPGNLAYARAAARNVGAASTGGTTSGITPVDASNQYLYNSSSKSSSPVTRMAASTTTSSNKSVASLPVPKFFSSGGGGGGGGSRRAASAGTSSSKTPLISGVRLLPLPNRSLIKFAKRKRYK